MSSSTLLTPASLSSSAVLPPVPPADLENRVLIFLHLMKAAGTTLNIILRKRFSKRETLSLYETPPEQFAARYQILMPAERLGLRLVRGHMAYGYHHTLDQPAWYLSMVRDPVERVLSYYDYILSYPLHPYRERFLRDKITLEQFVTGRCTDVDEVSNIQTRFLAGEVMTLDDPGLLQRAIENIERDFLWVGLSERFDESMMLLKALTRWHPYTFLYWRCNVTRSRQPRQTIAPHVLDTIRAKNTLDSQLYAYVQARFQAQIAQIPGFEDQVRRYRQTVRRWSSLDRLFMTRIWWWKGWDPIKEFIT